jgi:hypothetical protein
MFGMIEDMSAVSTGSVDTSVFHGLSFGKILHAPAFVPGPGVPLDPPLEPPLDPPLDEGDEEEDEPHAATRTSPTAIIRERIEIRCSTRDTRSAAEMSRPRTVAAGASLRFHRRT